MEHLLHIFIIIFIRRSKYSKYNKINITKIFDEMYNIKSLFIA